MADSERARKSGDDAETSEVEGHGNSQEFKADVYHEDAASMRYQDALLWSRFKTAAVIEAGVFYAVWGENELSNQSTVVLAAGGMILMLILALLALMDKRDADSHKDRMVRFEEEVASFEFNQRSIELFSLEVSLKGSYLVLIIFLVLITFNFFALYSALANSSTQHWPL